MYYRGDEIGSPTCRIPKGARKPHIYHVFHVDLSSGLLVVVFPRVLRIGIGSHLCGTEVSGLFTSDATAPQPLSAPPPTNS
jgi:hypothetical protein